MRSHPLTKMNLLTAAIVVGVAVCPLYPEAAAADAPKKADAKPAAATAPQLDAATLETAQAAIQRGVNFLTDKQAEDGSWCGHPAITALACVAIQEGRTTKNLEIKKESIAKGRKFILQFAQKDGSIWMAGNPREFPTYTTSIVLASLAILNKPEDEAVMRAARKYLQSLHLDENNKLTPTKKDDPNYGGYGYGKEGKVHADLSNTQWVLEALFLTDYLDKEPKAQSPDDAKKADLAWQKAVVFMSRLQNVPESNDQVWVVKNKNDPSFGGFVYKPDDSKGKETVAQKESLRSYGSMTYAGLKSMIYAKLGKDDPRITAAIEWARKNYTLDENPGLGTNGHFYYLQTFAKACAVMGDETITTPDGRKHQWRADLVRKLVALQKEKGEWANENGRYMESIPDLVTAYSLIAMEAAVNPCLAAAAK